MNLTEHKGPKKGFSDYKIASSAMEKNLTGSVSKTIHGLL